MTTSPPASGETAEFDRQRRVLDQMITAHSILRDRCARRSLAMTCGLLVASTVATAFAFAAGEAVVRIGPVVAQRSTWLGWFAVLTFIVTLVDLTVDWKAGKRRHDDAVRRLSGLKAEYRIPSTPEEQAKLSMKYQIVMDSVPAIPDRLFPSLKAAHLRKTEISRLLSERPGISPRAARKALRRRAREHPTS
ncbi:hypothetical protein [Actinokineospora enzanensis]|uniref:hypothetical protein n=1 Tax=Actinokineospora enzanensis TaxID=155975 RepID=UPI00035D4BE3|nr:hypothetical protein [Actinokineospora enzanensis]